MQFTIFVLVNANISICLEENLILKKGSPTLLSLPGKTKCVIEEFIFIGM